jgi:hypothetical protein
LRGAARTKATRSTSWCARNSTALEKVLLCEEYARIDLDGDGIAERVKVFRVENEILIDAESGEPSIETVEEQPFAVFCPFPRPHRLVGYSLADKVMDLQLARSYVARQLFDGMALANMPRPIVDSTRATPTPTTTSSRPFPARPIRVPGGAASVQPLQTQLRRGQVAPGHGVGHGRAREPHRHYPAQPGPRRRRAEQDRHRHGVDAAMGQQQEEGIAKRFAATLARLFARSIA